MQPMSSMQTTLLPGVTPGWNDPPPLGTPSNGSRLNRYRRVVDPSLSTGAGTPSYASPQNGMQMGTPQGMPPQQVQYAQPGYGMPAMTQTASMTGGYGNQYGYGTPEMAGGYTVQQQQQQPVAMQPHQQPLPPLQSMSPYGATTTVPPMMHHHPVSYGGVQPPATGYSTSGSPVVSPPSTGYGHPQSTVAAPPAMNPGAYGDYSAQILSSSSPHHKPTDPAEMINQTAGQQPPYNLQPKPPLVAGSSLDDSSLIFEPPNAVHGHTDQRHPGLPDPATYRAPSKAPGDVNLHPQMLVQFLMKAAFRLPLPKCQGVQLKLVHLQQQIESAAPSDTFNKFIMKLNYVVDAIDSERYEEALSYLDALSSSFPLECRQGEDKERQWMVGLRLLLSELRRPNSRIGSANGRPY